MKYRVFSIDSLGSKTEFPITYLLDNAVTSPIEAVL